jgi:hypothetical protein
VIKSYLIIGCGQFGAQAVAVLLVRDPSSRITVVDRDERAIQEVSSYPVEAVVADGLCYLSQSLQKGQPVDYIIPAVPFHLAFEAVLWQLRPLGAERRPAPVLAGLPNPIAGQTGDLYTSFARLLCPKTCAGPAPYCTVTGERREKPLYQVLGETYASWASYVIHSQQLGLGVGGFPPEALVNLVQEIKARQGKDGLILISTACRCHGVTSALSL